MSSKADEFLLEWRAIRRHTANEVSETEYRILNEAMHSKDPMVMAAAIDAVGNTPSLRMLRYRLDNVIAERRRQGDKVSGKERRWSGLAAKVWHKAKVWPRSDTAKPSITKISDRLFFEELWKAVEPYLKNNLDPLQKVDLAAAFVTGEPAKVLAAMRRLPQSTERAIISQEIQSMYPKL